MELCQWISSCSAILVGLFKAFEVRRATGTVARGLSEKKELPCAECAVSSETTRDSVEQWSGQAR